MGKYRVESRVNVFDRKARFTVETGRGQCIEVEAMRELLRHVVGLCHGDVERSAFVDALTDALNEFGV